MLEIFHIHARYNRWMNEKLYEVCDTMNDYERKADRGAFFKSVHGTLNHLLLADRVWLGRFTGAPFVVQGLDQELYADWHDLQRERRATDDTIDQWLATLSEGDFYQAFEFTSMTGVRVEGFELWQVMIHFFNHQTHHRGQLTTLMNQMGYDSGVTDLLVLPGLRTEEHH